MATLFPPLLFTTAVPLLLKASPQTQRFLPIAATIGLSIFGYTRVGMTGGAVPRYLLPLIPAFLIAIAVGYDELKNWPRWRFGLSLITIFSMLFVITERFGIASRLRSDDRINEIHEVTATFLNEGVSLVLADDYWNSNVYTIASHEKITFVPLQQPWNPPVKSEAAKTENHVGILITQSRKLSELGFYTWDGRRFKVTLIRRIGQMELFLGDFVNGEYVPY